MRILIAGLVASSCAYALDAPVVTATAKGPTQIDLSWAPVANPGYGYVVEIQSDGDPRYTSYTELKPLPDAAGYNCNPAIVINGAVCRTSDPGGKHVYNLPINGIPYWVTEETYIDPVDGTKAQFIARGLLNNTAYHFRVRSYSGNTNTSYSDYSKVATATTANYAARYVSPAGKDSNDGTAPDSAHAWKTLSKGSSIECGQLLIILGGQYANDTLQLNRHCTAESRQVATVKAGESAIITSPTGANRTIGISGEYGVVDGLTSASSSSTGDYDVTIAGSHNALLGCNIGPSAIPNSGHWGVQINTGLHLVYGNYIHDWGSPDGAQNGGGNTGFALTAQGGSNNNVIWSNHLTRGGHDTSLCIAGCNKNRWLNNVMDGGWGMCFETVHGNSVNNLIEGNICFHTAQLVPFFKPGMENSQGPNTFRRNIIIEPRGFAMEVSALGGTVANTLIYNNTFYHPAGCLFQSANGGPSAYEGNLWANNICFRITKIAAPGCNGADCTGIDAYNGAASGVRFWNNVFLAEDAKQVLKPAIPVVIWNRNQFGDENKSISFADSHYPPFRGNARLSVDPQFVDEAHFDFHLSARSPARSAGVEITDQWGSVPGTPDVGAYGIAAIQPKVVR